MDLKKYASGILFLVENFLGKPGGIIFSYEDGGTRKLGTDGVEIKYQDIEKFVHGTLYPKKYPDLIPHYYEDPDGSASEWEGSGDSAQKGKYWIGDVGG